MDDCWPERWANRIPRNPQARRKKTTRKSDRRELRAILKFPSLRACFHPSYRAEYRQYTTSLDFPGAGWLPSIPVLSMRCKVAVFGFLGGQDSTRCPFV